MSLSDREVADAVWDLFAALGLREGRGSIEYRRVLLGQSVGELFPDQPDAVSEQAEAAGSRVAEWAAEGRKLANRLDDLGRILASD